MNFCHSVDVLHTRRSSYDWHASSVASLVVTAVPILLLVRVRFPPSGVASSTGLHLGAARSQLIALFFFSFLSAIYSFQTMWTAQWFMRRVSTLLSGNPRVLIVLFQLVLRIGFVLFTIPSDNWWCLLVKQPLIQKLHGLTGDQVQLTQYKRLLCLEPNNIHIYAGPK